VSRANLKFVQEKRLTVAAKVKSRVRNVQAADVIRVLISISRQDNLLDDRKVSRAGAPTDAQFGCKTCSVTGEHSILEGALEVGGVASKP
jgi:hypothetical protein